MKKKILFVAACITGSSLFAQPVIPSKEDSARIMDEVRVDVTKLQQKKIESGKVLTVITQEELQQSRGKTLSEILNRQAGITISGANNTPATNQAIYVRGAHAANTLILVDGVPLYDASGETSQFDIINLVPDQVERIEIMKGAQSTLYGSDAVAGVINIITKKGNEKAAAISGTLSAGSYNTYHGSATLSGAKDKHSYLVSLSKTNSDGFSSAFDSTGKKNFDRDGWKQDALRLQYGFRASPRVETSFYGSYQVNRAELDAGAFADDKDYHFRYRDLQAGTSVKYGKGSSLLHFNYQYHLYKRKYTDDSMSVGGFAKYQAGNYAGRSHFAELYGNCKLQPWLELVAGADFRHQAMSQDYFSISAFGPFSSVPLGKDTTQTKQVGGYALLHLKTTSGFNAEAGGRWNHHSLYGNNFTWSLNPFYFRKGIKVFANLASAYRVPSLYQLYSEFGNKDLKPETTVSAEAGIQWIREHFNGRLVLFSRVTDDVFYFYTNPQTFASRYVNEDRQKDHGGEVELLAKISDQWSLNSSYAFVKGKLSTKDFAGRDTTYDNFYRKPQHTFHLDISYRPVLELLLRAHAKMVSKFYEGQFAAAPIAMKGYSTFDLYGAYTLSKHFTLFLDAQNITGTKYFDIRGFNSKRFNCMGGLNYGL